MSKEAWSCLIAEADFSQNTVTLAMQCEDYKVSAGQYWLSTTPQQNVPTSDMKQEHVAKTAKQRHEWVGLTEDEIAECFKVTPDQYLTWHIYKRIEAKLKEKNT